MKKKIDLNITNAKVEAKVCKIKAEWSSEMITDLNNAISFSDMLVKELEDLVLQEKINRRKKVIKNIK